MQRSRVEIHPQATRDLVEAAIHLADESGSDDLASRFLDAAQASLHRLAEMPALGVAREYSSPALTDVRMWRIAGFESYLIFYRPTEVGIQVIRVLHGSRDLDALFGGRV